MAGGILTLKGVLCTFPSLTATGVLCWLKSQYLCYGTMIFFFEVLTHGA